MQGKWRQHKQQDLWLSLTDLYPKFYLGLSDLLHSSLQKRLLNQIATPQLHHICCDTLSDGICLPAFFLPLLYFVMKTCKQYIYCCYTCWSVLCGGAGWIGRPTPWRIFILVELYQFFWISFLPCMDTKWADWILCDLEFRHWPITFQYSYSSRKYSNTWQVLNFYIVHIVMV